MARKQWLAAVVTGALSAVGLVLASPAHAAMQPSVAVRPQWVTHPAETDAETQLLDLLNGARIASGLKPLVRIPTLDNFARQWSGFMADGGCQVRQQTNLCHRTDLALVASIGSPKGWTWAGENVGRVPDGGTLESLHQAFMNSTGHRENALNVYYNAVGVGVSIDPNGMLYVTFEFVATVGAPNSTGPMLGFPELPGEMSDEDAFLFYLNFLREQAGVRPLVRNAVLDRETEYWSQRRLDGACGEFVRNCYRRDLGTVIKSAVGLGRAQWWGDLVGVTQASEPSAQLSWFTSSAPMRRVLMRPDINSIGIGIVTDDMGMNYMSVTVATARNAVNPRSPGGSACGWVQTTLRLRSKGVPVRVLQCALAEKGFWTGPIDGNFTTAVGTALKGFQRSKRLRATGLTDFRTRRLLGVS